MPSLITVTIEDGSVLVQSASPRYEPFVKVTLTAEQALRLYDRLKHKHSEIYDLAIDQDNQKREQ